MYAELAAPLGTVLGDRTAKEFATLRIETVGDLLRFIPRRYLSGTELTDLGTLVEGEHVAVIAKVAKISRFEGRNQPGRRETRPGRLEVLLPDRVPEIDGAQQTAPDDLLEPRGRNAVGRPQRDQSERDGDQLENLHAKQALAAQAEALLPITDLGAAKAAMIAMTNTTTG